MLASASLLLGALAPGAVAATDFERACHAALKPPEIRVELAPVTVGAVEAAPLTELTDAKWGHSDVKNATLGVTHATFRVSNEAELSSMEDPETGRLCFRPTRIVASLGFEPLSIVIASELAPGSCSHEAVLEHEHGHVRRYGEFLPIAGKAVQAALEREFGNFLGHAQTLEAARKALETMLFTVVRQAVKAQMEAGRKLHELLDTDEESARVLQSCGGKTEELVRQALGSSRAGR